MATGCNNHDGPSERCSRWNKINCNCLLPPSFLLIQPDSPLCASIKTMTQWGGPLDVLSKLLLIPITSPMAFSHSSTHMHITLPLSLHNKSSLLYLHSPPGRITPPKQSVALVNITHCPISYLLCVQNCNFSDSPYRLLLFWKA